MTVPTYHVAVAVGSRDSLTLQPAVGEHVVRLAMDGAEGDQASVVNQNVWSVLNEAEIAPSQMAIDIYRFAAAAYCADLTVPHRTAFDRWSRDIVIHMPVSDIEKWRIAQPTLTELLRFLTGDHWTLVLRERHVPAPAADRRKRGRAKLPGVGRVCLLSGGLDSAIGAIDALDAGEPLAFVSHNTKSGGASYSSPAQRAVVSALQRRFGVRSVHHLRFRVGPPALVRGVTESVTTTRSRSIIFFALGLLVAGSAPRLTSKRSLPLVIPENGLISLNVPLTRARLGSWSTRTTHPHTLKTLLKALEALGLPTRLEAPYSGLTKGEMVLGATQRDATLAREVIAATVSCAHPNQSRFLKRGRRQSHCGTCVPCIIRRAATQHADVDDGLYSFDLPREMNRLTRRRATDVRAFLYAVENRRRPAQAFDLSVSGPLHATNDAELRGLIRVYEAGMDEIARSLRVSLPSRR